MEIYLSLMKIILVQWPDFKGDLDIDCIWVFISFYVNTGIGGPKSQICPSQVLSNFFHDALKRCVCRVVKKLSKTEIIVQT